MISIPQELVDSIISEVNGLTSLKACSLVCSSFREASQRILLRSLRIADNTPDYTAAYTLLVESPHIARYIRTLRVRLTWVALTAPSDTEVLVLLLEKLTSVDRFSIAADCAWDAISAVVPAVLNFIQRQKLDELHLSLIDDLPASVLAFTLTHASMLSFHLVTMGTSEPKSLRKEPIAVGQTKSLSLIDCNSLDNVLDQQDLRPYTANLQTLSIRPQLGYSGNAMSGAARTLKHLLLDCAGLILGPPVCRLPPLPVLRTVQFEIPFSHPGFYEVWFTAMFASFLPSIPPSVIEISVTDSTTVYPDPLPANTLAKIDNLLADYATGPSLRWRVGLPEAGPPYLHDFEANIQQRMPRLHLKRRVTVDWRDDPRKWPPRM
ncbi:hypothetical protein K438DRAFT_2026862 [Mycena galopus ATCC 62051]|nr:hypothetical protein K438DRAFT_2026862 [Mycena galopus ATCC 62051]